MSSPFNIAAKFSKDSSSGTSSFVKGRTAIGCRTPKLPHGTSAKETKSHILASMCEPQIIFRHHMHLVLKHAHSQGDQFLLSEAAKRNNTI